MVTNSADENDMGCSDEFTLLASATSPDVGEDGYSLVVTSPSNDDVAMAGEEYTVEVSDSLTDKTIRETRLPEDTGKVAC